MCLGPYAQPKRTYHATTPVGMATPLRAGSRAIAPLEPPDSFPACQCLPISYDSEDMLDENFSALAVFLPATRITTVVATINPIVRQLSGEFRSRL
jgi:hypothetical protein